MMRVECHPAPAWPACPRVKPPAPTPPAGVNEHRLAERPILCTLLEHLPGDVPFSTHMELENRRARLVRRAELDPCLPEPECAGPSRACPSEGKAPSRSIADAQAADWPTAQAAPQARVRSVVKAKVTMYVQRVERWPLGGLIDLIV